MKRLTEQELFDLLAQVGSALLAARTALSDTPVASEIMERALIKIDDVLEVSHI